ncbi:hypothetical protein EI94DRAFT_1800520 [Lactarius quietus]|nr:hypothetical protein EI94DRAFT_1800520 [Lactarius quietus]
MKVEELKSAPNEERDDVLSAPELAQRAIVRELNAVPKEGNCARTRVERRGSEETETAPARVEESAAP